MYTRDAFGLGSILRSPMVQSSFHHEEDIPPPVYVDVTSAMDVALIIAFATSLHLLRRRHIILATLAHALSIVFLVATVGHYVERHIIGIDRMEDLVRRRPRQQTFRDWSTAVIMSAAAAAAVGVCVYDDTANKLECFNRHVQVFLPGSRTS